MTPIRLFLRRSPAAVLAVFHSAAMAAPGDVDMTFNPIAGGRVLSTALQAGGKILVAGEFTSMGGQPRNYLARLDASGTLDPDFNPGVNDTVTCMAVLADGDIVIGGEFTAVGTVTRRRLARLNEDGTLDEGFNPDITGGSSPIVHCVALEAGGKLVIGGSFTSVGGTGRNRIARLNADGTLDTAFNPGAGGTVRTIAVQTDGKIVVGGQFGTLAGGSRNFLARIDAGGILDADFDPNMNNIVNCVALQKDGKILAGGEFTTVGAGEDQETQNFFARLDTGGDLELEFNPDPNGPVRSLAVQTDGKIIFGGDFLSLGTTARNRIARLEAGGAPDAAFDPNAGNAVYTVSVQADGKVLTGGAFTSIDGQSRNRLARLDNDSATATLTIPAVNRVQWLRGGASAEAQGVTFQLSGAATGPWTALGSGSRITGGWELTGLSLPATGRIRAVASTIGGQYNGSPGVVESVMPFLFEPEIAVEQPAGTNLTTGTATVNFGVVLVGANKTLTFTVRNTGLHNLTGLGIGMDGDNAAEFSASAPPAPVAAGSSTTFTLTFTPGLAGAKAAELLLSSNDANENPFKINLVARALVPNGDEDGDGMTNAAEVMLARSDFDPLTNSAALITQLRASGVFPASDIHALSLTQPVLEKNVTTGHFLLRIGVEKSSDMSSWTPLPETVDFDIEPAASSPFFYRVFGKRP